VLLTGILLGCGSKEAATGQSDKVKTPSVDLHTAIVTDNLEAVKQHIAAGSDLNIKDPFGGSSPLITASVFGKEQAAKFLVEAGADINYQNNEGSTALHTAAFFCHPEIVKLLLDNKADKAVKNKYGATALDNVSAPFNQMKDVYDMLGSALAPIGLKLDYARIEKTRPVVAELLQ
jgi:ankyrin repeat protein